jgi:beta-glucanase (GH16 family)
MALAGVVALVAAASLSACAPMESSRPASTAPPTVERTAPATPPLDKSSFHLVFHEDFDGESLDHSKWIPQLAWGKVNGEEQQYYDPSALKVSDGMLTITASKQPAGGKPYMSGAIASFEHHEIKYGYVEMRAQVPKGQGLWPSFWMLSTNLKDPTEIDIAEFKGQNPHAVQTTLHWGMGANFKHSSTYTGPDFSAGFHTYGIDWQPDRIVWYVDGIERFRATDHIPDIPMYIIANLSVGGRYPGPPDATTPTKAEYKIDYIRVYEH